VFLPLKARTISKLVEGKIQERDISQKAVKQWYDEKISVYIPILEVFPTSNRVRDKRVAAFLLRNAIRWAVTLENQGDIQGWYTIVSRSKGKKMVEKLGFEQINTLDDGERECYKLQTMPTPSKLLDKFVQERQNKRK
jgi:hypothetical protein